MRPADNRYCPYIHPDSVSHNRAPRHRDGLRISGSTHLRWRRVDVLGSDSLHPQGAEPYQDGPHVISEILVCWRCRQSTMKNPCWCPGRRTVHGSALWCLLDCESRVELEPDTRISWGRSTQSIVSATACEMQTQCQHMETINRAHVSWSKRSENSTGLIVMIIFCPRADSQRIG